MPSYSHISFKTDRSFYSHPSGVSNIPNIKLKRGGYVVQLRRKGKFKTVSDTLEYGQALFLGKQIAENTLAATFRIAASGQQIKESNLPSIFDVGERFRGYRILGGKQIETPNQYIQHRKYRLSSSGEKTEISQAKTISEMFFGKRKRG
jgi:hypothetical protein